MWLAELFYRLSEYVLVLGRLVKDFAYWLQDVMHFQWGADIMFEILDWITWLYYGLIDIDHEIRYWWDWITGIASDVGEALSKAKEALEWALKALTEIPEWILTKLSDAYDAVMAIAAIIGTTFDDIVQFVKDHAEAIYQTINKYITNVYNTIREYITNVYNTFKEYYYTIVGVTEEWVSNWVSDFVSAFFQPFTAAINLVNLWFDAIQEFFNDPLGTILAWGEGIADRHEDSLRGIFDKIMTALWR